MKEVKCTYVEMDNTFVDRCTDFTQSITVIALAPRITSKKNARYTELILVFQFA